MRQSCKESTERIQDPPGGIKSAGVGAIFSLSPHLTKGCLDNRLRRSEQPLRASAHTGYRPQNYIRVTWLLTITQSPTKTRSQFTAQQKAEVIKPCLQEILSSHGVAERLGLPSSRLARWVQQARIDRGQARVRAQGLLTSVGRAELNRLRKENWELRRERDLFKLAAAHVAKEQLPPSGFS